MPWARDIHRNISKTQAQGVHAEWKLDIWKQQHRVRITRQAGWQVALERSNDVVLFSVLWVPGNVGGGGQFVFGLGHTGRLPWLILSIAYRRAMYSR